MDAEGAACAALPRRGRPGEGACDGRSGGDFEDDGDGSGEDVEENEGEWEEQQHQERQVEEQCEHQRLKTSYPRLGRHHRVLITG